MCISLQGRSTARRRRRRRSWLAPPGEGGGAQGLISLLPGVRSLLKARAGLRLPFPLQRLRRAFPPPRASPRRIGGGGGRGKESESYGVSPRPRRRNLQGVVACLPWNLRRKVSRSVTLVSKAAFFFPARGPRQVRSSPRLFLGAFIASRPNWLSCCFHAPWASTRERWKLLEDQVRRGGGG